MAFEFFIFDRQTLQTEKVLENVSGSFALGTISTFDLEAPSDKYGIIKGEKGVIITRDNDILLTGYIEEKTLNKDGSIKFSGYEMLKLLTQRIVRPDSGVYMDGHFTHTQYSLNGTRKETATKGFINKQIMAQAGGVSPDIGRPESLDAHVEIAPIKYDNTDNPTKERYMSFRFCTIGQFLDRVPTGLRVTLDYDFNKEKLVFDTTRFEDFSKKYYITRDNYTYEVKKRHPEYTVKHYFFGGEGTNRIIKVRQSNDWINTYNEYTESIEDVGEQSTGIDVNNVANDKWNDYVDKEKDKLLESTVEVEKVFDNVDIGDIISIEDDKGNYNKTRISAIAYELDTGRKIISVGRLGKYDDNEVVKYV